MAALACPPDPPDTAWLRLFTLVADVPMDEMWSLLWERARGMLQERGVQTMAVLSMDEWIGELCARAGFEQTHSVVVLGRPRGPIRQIAQPSVAVKVRQAKRADQEAIIAADLAAFKSPWQMSPELIVLAIGRADLLTVAELDNQVVGYQLSTPSHQGAHLARLAVLPHLQGRGIGGALVAHLIDHYTQRGAREVTVNTQDSNTASLALYQRYGFALTQTRFPVYQHHLG
jgi:ribosomal-protein-alanine N-acetyltransferase